VSVGGVMPSRLAAREVQLLGDGCEIAQQAVLDSG
jgi:hypothetical protein